MQLKESNKVLVVAAHPDDEVLGCGGTLAKLIAANVEGYVVILGEGITSRYDERTKGMKSKELQALKGCVSKAAKILGVKKTFSFDFPDNRFDSVALLDIVKVIEKVKNEVRPETLLTHYRNDLNVDHRITYNAVLTACRPLRGETVKKIYSFELLSSTEWNYPNSFTPNIYIDISESIGKKVEALKAYKSEIRDWPHPRSAEAVEILAQKRGFEIGLDYAEAFMLVRDIRRGKVVI